MGIKSGKPGEFHVRPFEKLKKQITRSEASAPPAALPPETKKPPTDDDLFTSAMNGVQVIEEFRVLPCNKSLKRAAPERKKTDLDAEALTILEQIASGEHPINLSDTQEYVEWTSPDFRNGFVEELHAGRFAIQGLLDLHGFTGGAVNEELDVFLDEAFARGWQCVKIIHGRGLRSVKGPVLKDAVIRRLAGRYRKRIIAFVSARQCDGGLGALYVLLGKR